MVAGTPAKLLEPRRGGRTTDRRAWACLERCRRKLALKRLPLPIPVEEWIESPLGIRFGFQDLSDLGENVLGAAYLQDREILIDERVLEHDGRFRFTCAHELGHIVLHRSVSDCFLEASLDVTYSRNRYERQADCFAAAFLMPLPSLERTIIESLDERGLKRADCVYELMHATPESEWLWRYRVLPTLTKTYGVSLSAAVYRCTDLQASISEPAQLLPRALVPRLLQRARHGDDVNLVEIDDGVPRYRDLFTASTKEGDG
jgi:Zn-dependent peptidase ImmA (M78 family)